MVSKVGSKAAGLHTAMKRGYNLLCSLRTNMNNIYCRNVFSVMSHYKRHYTFFLTNCMTKVPWKMIQLQYNRRSFPQVLLWYHVPNNNANSNPVNYGYTKNNDGQLYPVIRNWNSIPEGFSLECGCKKFTRKNPCQCRSFDISCYKYCSYNSSAECFNQFSKKEYRELAGGFCKIFVLFFYFWENASSNIC